MALIAKDADRPKERPPWRGLVVGAVAALVFILVLAISAFMTNDTTRGVPPHDAGFVDAGVADAGFADAGFVDAGAAEGPATEPDSGPIVVPGPPVDPNGVASAVLPVVEECLKAALRFDPALGGKATLRVIAGHGALVATLPGVSSPVLARCVASKGRVGYPEAPREPVAVEAHLLLDGLRQTVRLLSADVAP